MGEENKVLGVSVPDLASLGMNREMCSRARDTGGVK